MARKAKYILKDIDPDEFSLVPIGENGKRFFLLKSNDNGEDETMMVEEIAKSVLKADIKEEIKIDEIMKSASIDDNSQAALKAAIRLMSSVDVSSEIKKSLLETAGVVEVAVLEPVAKADAEVVAIEEKNINVSTGGERMNEVFKGLELPAETLEKLETILKGVEASANERVEKMAKDLKAERDARLTKEYVAKAASFSNLSIKADEFGIVLKELSERYPEGYEAVTTVLKGADTLVGESNLFKEVGTSKSNDAGSDPWAKIERLADEKIEKSNGELSKADALNKVLATAEGQKLYAEYDNARMNGGF